MIDTGPKRLEQVRRPLGRSPWGKRDACARTGPGNDLGPLSPEPAYRTFNPLPEAWVASTVTLKRAIEEALQRAAPDLERIEAEGVADGPAPAGPSIQRMPNLSPA
jgi:hypothetical protein